MGVKMANTTLIEVLGTMAVQEQAFIWRREMEGIQVAKEKGKYLGRLELEKPCNWDLVITQR